ncbi:MAG: amidophosphoribosyltransferase [Acidobacteriota bacterium]
MNANFLRSWRDECGVAAVYGHPEAANLVYLALYALQHRGQESAGIVSADAGRLIRHVGMGLVADIFAPAVLAKLPGRHAIGHVRYGTAGGSVIENAQPLLMSHRKGGVALAHNGNLVNANQLRTSLENEGAIFRSSADTESLLHLIARSRAADTEARLVEALEQAQGAYSMAVMDGQRLIAVRDPHGFRPLSLGRLPGGEPVIASESCAFDLIGARLERDIAPGEMLVIGPGSREESYFPLPVVTPHPCIFEYVYFSRPDSVIYGRPVSEVRRALGVEVAKEHPVDADLVAPVPDSGVPAATGFAHQSNLPFDFALVRNHYVGRTFIEPAQSIRHFGVKVKLNAVRALCGGRRVVLVDDSLVRGTTMAKIVSMIRLAGAREVHVRISCPPTIAPCYYGVDTPDREELIASHTPQEGIRRFIGADSLGYLSLEGMLRAVGSSPGPFCTACYTDHYPVPVTDPLEHKREARSP